MGTSKSSLILAGIALTALLNAGISFFTLINDDVLSSYNAFSVGGLAGVSVKKMAAPFVMIAVCLALALLFSREIGLLLLGDHGASSLGVNVKMLRILCMVLSSALAGAVVSFAGLLGFVGLVIPHIARRVVGYRVSSQIVSSALLGAILVILADLAGRLLAAPSEIPVGIMMAFIGAPFFLWLLLKRRGGRAEGEV
jgi:iron complex transport system permease protein